MITQRYLTPPKVGRILGCGAEQVLRFIASGELKATNLSLLDRPRWKINPDDLQSFLDARSNQAAIKPGRKRQSFVKPVRRFL